MDGYYVIRRCGKYWAGFNTGAAGRNPRLKPRSIWSKEIGEAVQFVRGIDADEIIHGLRLYRLSPSARFIRNKAS